VLTVPLLGSLVPESVLKGSGGGIWTPLSADEFKQLQDATKAPVKLSISFKYADGYMPPADDNQFVWGIRLSPEQEAGFKEKRPDLFADPLGKVDYPAVTMSFVVFSSICPHLGCHFNWDTGQNRFICPCHGSEFSFAGDRVAGPAPRGLDPLPLRSKDGTAEITWIQYKQQQSARVIVAYS
jgi:Rieske Fe-S protein